MRKFYSYGVAIWIVANVLVFFFLPGLIAQFSELFEINKDVVIATADHAMIAINPIIALILGVIGVMKNKNSDE